MDVSCILKGRPAPPEGPWPLELSLVAFSERSEDTWTLADSYQSVLILGENGSGKTSGSGNILARKYLESGFGGLVLCFKTDEADEWRKRLKAAGREQDGRFFSVDSPYRFNFVDYEAKTGGIDFLDNIATLLMDVASIQNRNESSGKNESFWISQRKKFLSNALTVLMLARQPVQMNTLYRMMNSAPRELRLVKDEKWIADNFLYQLLLKADGNVQDFSQWELVSDYWLKEIPSLHSETFASIVAGFTGMFDPITRGAIGKLFGTDTNLTPDDILAGKVVVIDIPVSKYREVGQFAALIWAQLFQRAVDRRVYAAPHSRPLFLWEDESHYFTIEQDATFQTTSRSKGISVVRLTQNVPNFLDAYGTSGKHKVDTLLGNHATKIFHRNGDPTTNEWASRVIAKDTHYRFSVSSNTNAPGQHHTSVSEHEEDSCPPRNFIGLRNGGHKNKLIVEGILFQSGRLWKKHRRWIVRKFSQI